MLRQYHVKLQDLNSNLRGFVAAKEGGPSGTPEDWSAQESALFEPGMVIFCLEPVAPPPGLSIGKKDSGTTEMFRVKDCCVVVNYEDGRQLVVNITTNAYELRFLDVLLLEKARKAILDGRNFRYVAVKPTNPLSAEQLKELGQLGALYAQGGSRRSLAVDNSSTQEPAIALLSALGAKITVTGLGKQVLDIGSVCQMLFAPPGPATDNNRELLKSSFTSLPAASSYTESAPSQEAMPESAKGPAIELDLFGDPIVPPAETVKEEQTEPTAVVPAPAPAITFEDLPAELDSWAALAPLSDSAQVPSTEQVYHASTDLTNISWPDFDFHTSAEPTPDISTQLSQWTPTAAQDISWPPTGSSQNSLDFPGSSLEWPNLPSAQEAATSEPVPEASPEPIQHSIPETVSGSNFELTSEPQETSVPESKYESKSSKQEPAPEIPAIEFPKTLFAPDSSLNSNLKSDLESNPEKPNVELPAVESKVEIALPEPTPAQLPELPIPVEAPPVEAIKESIFSQENKPTYFTESQTKADEIPSVKQAELQENVKPTPLAEPIALTTSAEPAPVKPITPQLEPIAKPEVPAAKAPPEQSLMAKRAAMIGSSKPATSGPEPKAVMNEMATLMNKLELQVTKAAKHISTKATALRKSINENVETLVKEKAHLEKESIRSLLEKIVADTRQLDEISEEIHLQMAETAANGRYTVKQLLPNSQERIDEQKESLHQALRDECGQFHSASDTVTSTNKTTFLDLVHEYKATLEALISSVSSKLEDTRTYYTNKFNTRLTRFEERLADEVAFIGKTLERNVQSMLEEVDSSSDRASEKLKAATTDYEQTIHHTVKTAQLNIARAARRIISEILIPHLRERREILRSMCGEMAKRFSEESQAQARSQIAGLETSLGSARQQLQSLVQECTGGIENIGDSQQVQLEDVFNQTSAHVEELITQVEKTLADTQAQIDASDAFCKKLAETSSVDSDPVLTEKRTSLTNNVLDLKEEAANQLKATIELKSELLEELCQGMESRLISLRTEQTHNIKATVEKGLTQIRQAIQDTFVAIQADREKYME